MDLTVTDLKQGAVLSAAGTSTNFVADRSHATVPGVNLRITNHLLIGTAIGAVLVKLLN